MPWAQFAQQWGGANINVHRQDVIDTIEEERTDGTLDDNATLTKANTSKRDKDGNFRYGQTMRLGTKWGTTRDADDGRFYQVNETDTFTWKQVPEPADDDDNSTLIAGEDDDDGSSLATTVPASVRSSASSYAPSRASSSRSSAPVRHEFLLDEAGDVQGDYDVEPLAPPRVRARVTAPIARGKPRTIRSMARREMLGPPLRVSRGLNPRGQDLPTRRIPSVITPPGSEEDEPPPRRAPSPPRRAPSPPRRFRMFREASPARPGPRRSARERVPVGFYDPTIGKGWSPEQMTGCGGFITSSDGFYNY